MKCLKYGARKEDNVHECLPVGVYVQAVAVVLEEKDPGLQAMHVREGEDKKYPGAQVVAVNVMVCTEKSSWLFTMEGEIGDEKDSNLKSAISIETTDEINATSK